MNSDSPTPKEIKLRQLKALMPEVFSGDKIDFERLKATLGEDIDFSDERYVLNWAGKSDAFRMLRRPAGQTLIPVRAESLNFDTTENIFIEGENLEVLKILQKSYLGKIKLIYIDPPYNTGNDSFIYSDKFAESRVEYQQRIGDRDEEGRLTRDDVFRKNGRESGQYHSNWLNMIYPRLFLARDLLRQDGVILVSIDDNEAYNLRLVMNEIFGEENFVAQFIWTTKKGAQGMLTRNRVVANHEYVLAYAREGASFSFTGEKRDEKGFSNPDNDPRGPWKRQYLQRLGQNLPVREVVNPANGMVFRFESPYSDETIQRWIIEKRILFPDSKERYPARKEFLGEYSYDRQLVTHLGLYPTKSSTEKLHQLFAGCKIFTNPKPLALLRYLLSVTINPGDTILDFFSGSATTAHALMRLNADLSSSGSGIETKEGCRYICVQLPERCDEKSEAYKAGYKTIADIARERIRRAAAQISAEVTPEGERTLDLGFKLFKVSKSHFREWRGVKPGDMEGLKEMMELSVDPVVEYATEDNLIYELLLIGGRSLNSTIERKDGYISINRDEIVLMLEKATQEVVDAVLRERPHSVICLDRLFVNNDRLKGNTILQMRDAGIEFRTI